MNKNALIVVAAVVIVGGLSLVLMQNSQKDSAMMEQKAMEEKALMEKAAMEKEAMMQKDGGAIEQKEGAAMEKKDGAAMEKTDAAMSKGSYEVYSPEKLSWAKDGGKVVLFFKASWCPTCKALDANIKSQLSAIPAGVTILELDYDKSTELKQKYGVTMQHTLVQVDADGKLIGKWSGGNTLSTIIEKLK